MNKVLVIGPTYRSEIIVAKGKLNQNNTFTSDFYNDLCGGQYIIANNLAVMDVSTYFITRLAYDEWGNKLLNNLDKNNVVVNFTCGSLTETPQKTYLFSQEGIKTFDNIPYNCYPSIEDSIPSEFFVNTDYAVINVINSNYLKHIIKNYPNVRYICDNNIPSDEFLELLDGIILDIDYIRNYVDEKDFSDFAKSLLHKGVNYLLITDGGKGIYIYSAKGNDYLSKDDVGSYTIGCHETFVSMFVASRANGLPFSQAINYGLNLANDFSFSKAIKLEKDFFR